MNELNLLIIANVLTLLTLIVYIIFSRIEYKQISKNMNTDIIIKKADYTNQFVKDFVRIMPSLNWCNKIINDSMKLLIKEKDDKKIKNFIKVYNHYKKEIYHDFDLLKYYEILNDNNLTVDDVDVIFKKYYTEDNYEFLIGSTLTYHKYYGHIRECYFDTCHSKHFDKFTKLNAKLYNLDEEDTDMIIEINKQINILNSLFSSSIRQCECDTFNDFECVALNTQFGLLDYEKLTPLIFAPLNHFIDTCYIRIINSVAKGEKNNERLFSNIIDLYKKITSIKIEQDSKINSALKNAQMEKTRIMSDSNNMGEKVQ